jgi:hypothetical protein
MNPQKPVAQAFEEAYLVRVWQSCAVFFHVSTL